MVAALAVACPSRDAAALVSHLWQVVGVRGDEETYDSPSNSFVGECVERRRGIPITLAALAMGLGDRLGIGFVGIGMPGHFLLRERDEPRRFFDPFHGPAPIDERGCVRLYRSVTGRTTWSPDLLDPVSPDDMAFRMLTNLKSVFRRTGDDRSLGTVMRLRRTFVGDDEEGEFARLMRGTN